MVCRMRIFPTFRRSPHPVCREYTWRTWFGAFAPAATPKPLADKLSAELIAIIHSNVFEDRLVKLGGYVPIGDRPDEFRKFLEDDRARGEELVRVSGVKLSQ